MDKIVNVMTVQAKNLNYDEAVRQIQLQIQQKCAQIGLFKTRRILSVSCTNLVQDNATGLPLYVFTAFITVEIDGNESIYS